MSKELIDKLISKDILKTSGFINIDKSDVENLRKKSAFIDGVKSIGHPSDLSKMIEDAVNKVETDHRQSSKSALLVIKQAAAGELSVEDVMAISEAFSEKREDFDFVWGVSTDSDLSIGEISVIILLGF